MIPLCSMISPRLTLPAALLLGMASIAQSSEVDSFTLRNPSLGDARAPLNEIINTAFHDAAAAATEAEDRPCHASTLHSELRTRLGSPAVIGLPELRILLDSSVPSASLPIGASVFRNFPVLEFPQMWLVGLTLANLLHFGDFFFGTDKIGHFFDEGWTYYEMIHDQGKTLTDALNWGVESERGGYGLAMNGVFSWGDLLVNFQGLRFWKEVATRNFRCHRGHWEPTEPFDLANYVDAGWDEGINCSEFRNLALKRGVEREIRALERARGEPLMCPIIPSACEKLQIKYQSLESYVLSPLCRGRPALPLR